MCDFLFGKTLFTNIYRGDNSAGYSAARSEQRQSANEKVSVSIAPFLLGKCASAENSAHRFPAIFSNDGGSEQIDRTASDSFVRPCGKHFFGAFVPFKNRAFAVVGETRHRKALEEL